MPIEGADLSQVLDWMKGKAPLKPFSQSDFRKAVGYNFVDKEKDMSNGYCAGVCVDWIRRVLLGGRADYAPNAEKKRDNTQESGRQLDSVRRMANAWAGPAGGSGARSLTFVSDSSSTKGQFIAALQRMQAMQADLIQPNAETLALFGKFWKSYSIGSADGDKCTDTHWSKALIASMINDASGKNDLSSEMQWSKFAPFLDTIYAQQRKQRGKEAGSRPFTGIEVENASAAKKYDFPNAWISPMKDMFAQNRCILLGVMNPVTDKGHAVALRREASSYELMDPNFGVFACKDWDTLERFLYMLFGNMKLTTASKVIVGPVYGASAEQKVDWTVFRRASTGAAVAAVGAQ